MNRLVPKQAITEEMPRASRAATKTGSAGSHRYGFVDLMRGFALVVMIETHVVNAYVPASARTGAFFFWLSFVNGLVAPSFLFASGFSLVLQARRRWDEWLHAGPAFWTQVRRLAFILPVAYLLHLPHFGLSKFLIVQDLAFWNKAFQVDVLQCIVASLLFIDALILLTRRQAVFAWSAALAAAGAALATPWVWSQDFTGRMPLHLALFLNPHGVSLFPLFPWISFVLAGAVASHLFLNAAARQADSRHMRCVFLFGFFAILAALSMRSFQVVEAWNIGFYKTSPLFVLIRLGCVLIIYAGLYASEKRLGRGPKSIHLAGQESLLVYVMHLLLIFGVLRGQFVSSILGREAGYAASFLLSAGTIVLMLWLARLWNDAKRSHPGFVRPALAVLGFVSVALFLLR